MHRYEFAWMRNVYNKIISMKLLKKLSLKSLNYKIHIHIYKMRTFTYTLIYTHYTYTYKHTHTHTFMHTHQHIRTHKVSIQMH